MSEARRSQNVAACRPPGLQGARVRDGRAHSINHLFAETPREASHFDLASAGIASAMKGHHRSLMARILDKIFRRFSSGISLFGFAKSSRLFSTFDQN